MIVFARGRRRSRRSVRRPCVSIRKDSHVPHKCPLRIYVTEAIFSRIGLTYRISDVCHSSGGAGETGYTIRPESIVPDSLAFRQPAPVVLFRKYRASRITIRTCIVHICSIWCIREGKKRFALRSRRDGTSRPLAQLSSIRRSSATRNLTRAFSRCI